MIYNLELLLKGWVMTAVTAAESFRAALKKLVETRGHGAQAELAEALSSHRSAINDMIAGRRGASAKMQERVAAHFGLSLGEMLRIGEHLLAGRVVFPWRDHLDGLSPCQQLLRIVELANDQVGHPQDNLQFLKTACKFLDGRQTAADVYQSYLKLIRARQNTPKA